MPIKPVLLTIALLAALPSAATAATRARTSNPYTSSIRVGTISTDNGYPAVGGTALLTGTWKAKPFGNGSLVDHVKIVGHPTANVFTLTGDEVAVLPLGSITDSYTGWAMLQPDGSLATRITGHATGGTGIYTGARGTYVFDGSTPAGSTVTTGGSRGTIIY
jgi:hypothetical protein